MTATCSTHRAYIYDRGGTRVLGEITGLTRVIWNRTRDDTSEAVVTVGVFSAECERTLGLARPGRSELVIFRGDARVWEGPVTHAAFQSGKVEITARDVTHYLHRTALTQEYNSSYPNVAYAITRLNTIITTELARMEAQNPPINVLPYLTLHQQASDAKTTSHTMPFEMTVWEHLDTLAARGGVDYTAVGRAIHLFDVDTPLGKTPPISPDDFFGPIVVTEYGMDLATKVYVTDGQGHAGVAGSADPYYGLVERVYPAFDETESRDELDLPSVAEMTSQAERLLSPANPTPSVIRVPENSRLKIGGTLTLRDLVPGIWSPFTAEVPGRSLKQWQKLDSMRMTENPIAGESVQVSFSPAPHGGVG